MASQRADARRNYARILAVAEREVAEYGADVSMEQIARTAGVGSATVRRHFPSRSALLYAVFAERIELLCVDALELVTADDPRAALLQWLEALAAYVASTRGVAESLVHDEDVEHACSIKLAEAGGPLLRRAKRAGAVAGGIATEDLIALVSGIALAAERYPDPAAQANRLLGLVIAGISPRG